MTCPTADTLANRQLWRTFWGGLALMPLACLAVALALFSSSRAHSGPQLAKDFLLLTGGVGLLATLPALLFCWLHRGIMRWLFSYYLAKPGAGRQALVILGTLALFEVSVVAGTLVLFLVWQGYIEFIAIWRICMGFSLPWLLAAPGASWYVLRPATVPGKGGTTDRIRHRYQANLGR